MNALILTILVFSSCIDCSDQFIVKVGDLQVLLDYARDYDITVSPYIHYPNPSPEVTERFGDYYIVTVPLSVKTMEEMLTGLPEIDYISPNARVYPVPVVPANSGPHTFNLKDTSFGDPYTPNDPLYPDQWDKTVTRINWGWHVTQGESDIVIAIIDTGIDEVHEDLDDVLITSSHNLLYDNSDVQDSNGHGTSVTGVVAAEMDNYLGVAGTAPGCSIMTLVACNGGCPKDAWHNAVLYAADNGADVINMSFGGFYFPDSLEEEVIDYAWKKGCFMCAASGNDNQDASDYFPASYEHVMAVGATTSDDERAGFSNFGNTVAIYAPGSVVQTTGLGGGYIESGGTSIASPEIAGLAALIWSANPDFTNQDVWDVIIAGADTIDTDVGRVLRMGCPLFKSSTPRSDIRRDSVVFEYYGSGPTQYTLSFYDVSGRKNHEVAGKTSGETGQITYTPPLPPGVYFWVMRTPYGASRGRLVYLK